MVFALSHERRNKMFALDLEIHQELPGRASGQVPGYPTLFIDGVVHRGGYDPPTLLAALATT